MTAAFEQQVDEVTVDRRINDTLAATRVLHLINGEHYSGAERVQDLLALRLAEFGFEVGFACLKPGRFAAGRQSQQAPIYNVAMRNRFDLSPVVKLARILKRDGFRLLHTHTPRAALVGRLAAALAGVPMIHHVHSPTTADSTHRVRNRINAAIERLSLTGAAGVVCVSHSLGGYASTQGILPARICVVPNGVPVQGPLAERAKPTGAWTLGSVALFRPRKGLEVLLDALAILRSKGVNVRFRAVGGFETTAYERQIQGHVKQLGIGDLIDWVGFTRDVTGELAKMDLFVLPSLFGEGLPMVILEAMAAGVPVIATAVEGVPEAIRHGVDGLIAAPGDPADLAHAILQVIRGDVDWDRLRIAAHRRQAERFSDRTMARGVAQVYRRVLGR